jgi:hypothetical protein
MEGTQLAVFELRHRPPLPSVTKDPMGCLPIVTIPNARPTRPRLMAARTDHARNRYWSSTRRPMATIDRIDIASALDADAYPNLAGFTAEYVFHPGYEFSDTFEVGLDVLLAAGSDFPRNA